MNAYLAYTKTCDKSAVRRESVVGDNSVFDVSLTGLISIDRHRRDGTFGRAGRQIRTRDLNWVHATINTSFYCAATRTALQKSLE